MKGRNVIVLNKRQGRLQDGRLTCFMISYMSPQEPGEREMSVIDWK